MVILQTPSPHFSPAYKLNQFSSPRTLELPVLPSSHVYTLSDINYPGSHTRNRRGFYILNTRIDGLSRIDSCHRRVLERVRTTLKFGAIDELEAIWAAATIGSSRPTPGSDLLRFVFALCNLPSCFRILVHVRSKFQWVGPQI